MSSFKKLSKSDVTVVPYSANKQWTLPYCPYPTSSDYLTIYKGTNLTGSFSLDDDLVTEGQYERLVYSQINQLFYQDYTASLDTSSLMFTIDNYESASQQRPTSSYFIYNDNKNLVTSYPTGAMESIRVLAINQNIYGNKVLPNHFILSSSAYYVTDDGFGNLYDGSTHIGNLFYAHGLGIITNQDYQLMFPLPPIAKNDIGYFLTTDTKTISASLNDYARSGILNTSSLSLSGSTSGINYSWATGSNGTVVLTTTVAGTYSVYYTIGADVAGSCAVQLRSNVAKVTAIVTEPTTTTTSTTTTTTTVAPTTTTTTTTTTTAPPTTTSTTTTTTTVACSNVTAASLYGGVDIAAACANTSSRAADAFACLPPPYDMFALGTQWFSDFGLTTLYPTGSYAVHNPSLSNDNTWVIIGSGSIVQSTGSCITPTTTTTTTTTTTSTTTTTTTVAYQTYTIDSAASGDSGSACSGTTTTVTVYATPENNTPIVGMFLYTDTGLTTPFVGSAGWRKLVSPEPLNYAAEVSSSGELTNIFSCP
jgi:hypothetical protein